MPDYLIPHRAFTGNRPSMSIMLPSCDAFTVGQILALYEHRVAVQVRVLFGGGPLSLLPCFCCENSGSSARCCTCAPATSVDLTNLCFAALLACVCVCE